MGIRISFSFMWMAKPRQHRLSASHTLTGFMGLIKQSTEFTTNSAFPAQKTASQGRVSRQFFPLPSTREALVPVSAE